jgi:hypothetical protein
MSNKHPKRAKPSDADLKGNPLIGGSKGVTRAQASIEELDASKGANTIEGDVDNDTNPQGGIDKAAARNQRRTRRPTGNRASTLEESGKKHFGSGSQGKGAGTGAMTDLQSEEVGENMVLSNRDKARHPRDRGQDSKWVETEQLQDHESNKGRG